MAETCCRIHASDDFLEFASTVQLRPLRWDDRWQNQIAIFAVSYKVGPCAKIGAPLLEYAARAPAKSLEQVKFLIDAVAGAKT